jgi:hypothetical protein
MQKFQPQISTDELDKVFICDLFFPSNPFEC